MGLQHGVIAWGTTMAIPTNIPTLAERLREGSVSYRTVAVGKWHCGYASWRNTPTGEHELAYGWRCLAS